MDTNNQYKNHEECRTCGNCCKQWAFYISDVNTALRIKLLDTPDNEIQVIEIRDGLWKVILDFPCRNLIEEDGKYYCAIHKSIADEFCLTLPDNFGINDMDIFREASKNCPLIIKEDESSECE